ncbi:hypothetical protein Taci_1737 [Thermanaerovibrio acidaminovorans DSM 6589]|uniref:Uncharacterized protein n=1 Tax=Thermanaerovibrio acidaminovorans (strain ATCC 49978 / DSM 6589 / Su883) TaxID=525903 RepID=D1B7G0_THEAS|nr:hypothetical protein Taci_1737 [Thermanaerovibrio acidaminovorans DSM 6589]
MVHTYPWGGEWVRILVTGTRGKSSVVRLLVHLMASCGMDPVGRITGVVPRQISPRGERVIRRLCPSSVEEMRWWIGMNPGRSLVMENSAVRPDLQHLAARWLKPDLVVLTSARRDHQEEWGDSDPLRVLLLGVPLGTPLLVPRGMGERARGVRDLLGSPGPVVEPGPLAVGGLPEVAAWNLELAAGAMEFLGLPVDPISLGKLPGDLLGDFRVVSGRGFRLALAFSANDVESTGLLLRSLGWDVGSLTIWYHHRPDRPRRLREFLRWIRSLGLRREPILTGGSRWAILNPSVEGRWIRPADWREMLQRLGGMGDVFGCGNVSGLPLELIRNVWG